MSESKTGGIGFFGLLTIVFITLKLTNYIDWSWWWVLSPLWIPLAIIFAILVSMLGMGARVRQRRKR
jgi:ABC-type antimicrobial peptide transport system permease subunit